MIVPAGAKLPPLEQRKKRGFCKYHNFLGHKTSQCFLFRDLVQNAIQEGRLKFGEKSKNQMKIDADPLQVAEANYTEPTEVNMVEATEGVDNNADNVETTEGVDNNADNVEVTEGLDDNVNTVEVTEDLDANTVMVEVTEDFTKDVVMIKVTEDSDDDSIEHFICMAAEYFFRHSAEVERFTMEITKDVPIEPTESNLQLVTKETDDSFLGN